MEGKAALFKRFREHRRLADCLDTQDVDESARTVQLIAPVFVVPLPLRTLCTAMLRGGGPALQPLDIPVSHDDQHGTVIVVLSCPNERAAGGGQGHRRGSDSAVRLASLPGAAILKLLLQAGAGDVWWLAYAGGA